jgi:hypothetical protein
MKKILLLLLVVTTLCATSLIAQDEETVSFGVDAGLSSKYMWRGLTVVDDFVFQPAVTVSYSGFSAIVWANMDLTDVNMYEEDTGEFKFTEFDFILDYSNSFGGFDYSIGWLKYMFPNTGYDSTMEVYLVLGLPVILNPTFSIYQDVDMAEGTYISFGVSHSLPLGGDLALDLAAAGGYGSQKHNEYYWGLAEGTITDFLFSASMSFAITDSLTMTPSAGLSMVANSDLRDALETPDKFFFGAIFSY